MHPKILEEIKLKTEVLKVLLIALLADITAVLSLAKDQTGKPIELTYTILGFFSIFVLSIFSVLLYFKIDSIIKKS